MFTAVFFFVSLDSFDDNPYSFVGETFLSLKGRNELEIKHLLWIAADLKERIKKWNEVTRTKISASYTKPLIIQPTFQIDRCENANQLYSITAFLDLYFLKSFFFQFEDNQTTGRQECRNDFPKKKHSHKSLN